MFCKIKSAIFLSLIYFYNREGAYVGIVSLAWKFKVQQSIGDKTGKVKNFLFFLACNSSNVMTHFTCPHLALSVSCWYYIEGGAWGFTVLSFFFQAVSRS